MRRTLLTSLFAICAAAAVATAQAPQSTTPSPATSTTQAPASSAPATPTQAPAPSRQAAAGADRITLEGCVQRSAAVASSTSGATGTSGSAGSSFILEKAAKPSAAATTTDSASPVAVVSTYRLDADDAKLTPHVGHKVEISGTVETAMGTATASAGASSPSASAANAPKLKVDTVKMLAASCTP